MDFFTGMCGSIVTGQAPLPDDNRFRIGQVEAKTAEAAVPGLKGAPLWSVVATASDVRMLHYVTNGGLCGVEVAEADAAEIDAGMTNFLDGLARRWGSEANLTEDETEEGSRTRAWRLHGPDVDLDVGLLSFQGQKEPQHIMTMARAKALPGSPPPSDLPTLPAARD
jgi:hypothetical protein